ncbi:MAG: peptide chain release factor 1 [Myxococcales bacterium]|nr:peptide chain release factor 1 [Myxococcales bacterium]MCB9752463.1 peptide chain release factor 1 [Myxococcales bacterium]
MLAKLERIADRHEELNAMLCDPEIASDKRRFLELSREHADTDAIVTSFREFRQVENNLEEARELLSDPDMRELAEADVEELQERIVELEARLQKQLLPKDPNDSKNVMLEIRAGTGGEEAALFAADLWRMYSRFAERQGWSVEPMNFSEASAGGLKEVVGLIKGRDVYAMLKFESGVHRVQRVPATESQGRIHTSAATVAIMPEAEDVDIDINPADLEWQVMRSSGAGGQHVNTTDSAVRVIHKPTGLAVRSDQEKSQTKNREIALRLLRSRMLDAEIQRVNAERAAHRKDQVGSGDRSEKVRTYNYPQDRVTDHRIGLTRHNLPAFMDGDVGDVVEALRAHDEAARLAEAKREP